MTPALLASITALLAAVGVSWEQVLTVGVSLVRAAAQLASDAGTSDTEFQARHAASMGRLAADVDRMLADLRASVKP